MIVWNPWHGCHKISPGCQNCYMFRRDEQNGIDSTVVKHTGHFFLPIRRNKQKRYILTGADNPIYVCLTSDFLIEEADSWRPTVWKMIRHRSDLQFRIITKRIHRLKEVLPPDWGDGYGNVTWICTCENQQTADERLPVLLEAPVVHREIIHEPMLERIEIEPYLQSGLISGVTCGGESGEEARVCDYDWILHTREQCMRNGVTFTFKQTGARFRKDGRLYTIDRRLQMSQAEKAGLNWHSGTEPLTASGQFDELFRQLSQSSFRSSFFLDSVMVTYCRNKGTDAIREHAYQFIRDRLAPERIPNDGKQTPTRGHPVFVAQHATATCCRKCLQKWHDIPIRHPLTDFEINYVADVIMEWIGRQLAMYDLIQSGGEEMQELFRLFEEANETVPRKDRSGSF